MVNLTQRQKNLSRTPKREDLPTMYDLPSEEVGESGLPDQYHPIQAQLLEQTFQPSTYPPEQVFSAMDLNLYYDVENTNRYKRPDWFGVVGVSRLYEQRDLRMSYVVWQEEVNPFMVVELLSPSTQQEDLGQTTRKENKPPTKWEVYEELLRVPYYIVYEREQDYFRAFQLQGSRYQEIEIRNSQLWLEELGLGLRLWQGSHKGIERRWLRFYDATGNLIPTEAEERERERQEKERERQEKEQARQEKERERQEKEQAQTALQELRDRLIAMGLDPDNLPNDR
ncbi:Uma2 family endonuclease [Roseofilum capinflatum]|uniref:Uma2 family endonuclease n=1 Tax=Roseofilum capinflatum BLCC-M114 TaxID=3022440 RepID=A0ABT7B0A5_9CYAN|nr:Uma2 family endonuclease [Roseofilum capinflatum]MDJ1172593.1 Uma2 family endonuclease [Roseofilum capinflatum BLCC-M114]